MRGQRENKEARLLTGVVVTGDEICIGAAVDDDDGSSAPSPPRVIVFFE